MRRPLAAPAIATLLLGGCYATPAPSDTGATARVLRVFAGDLSEPGFQKRCAGWQRTLAAVPGEFGRVATLAPLPAMATASLRSATALPQTLLDRCAAEAARPLRATVPEPARLAPDEVARDLADSLANVPYVLGLDRRPLGEHDDREHRTDPHDDRPEASWWQRLSRRLGL